MHDGNTWNERALRDAVLAGDADAWRQLYNAHYDRIAGYVNWRCAGSRELADDVLQETWVVAVRRLRYFEPAKGTFFDWLCGIASNSARNAIRKRRRQQARARPLTASDHPLAADASAAVERDEPVAAALVELPEHYEAVLRAKYLERLSVQEIAARRGETQKAVESLLSRARQAFREAYEKQ